MWKKFNFFDKHTVSDEKSSKFFSQTNVTCCTSGRSNIIFGDNRGTFHVMDKNLNTRQCKAFEARVNHIKHIAKSNCLVVVGDDGGEAYQDVLKIYSLDKYKEHTKEGHTSFGQYQLVRDIKIFSQIKDMEPYPVCCFEANQDFNCIALGLGNGKIIIFEGDFTKQGGKSSHKVFLLDGAPNERITGLGFKRYGNSPNDYTLFCCSLTQVFKYSINTNSSTSQRALEQSKVILDDTIGCEVGCSTLSNDGDFVVSSKSAVWFFKPEGKGSCFAFEGKKILSHWFRNYLIVISSDINTTSSKSQQVITIYDLKNKYIAFRYSSDKLHITHILQEWGNVFLLSNIDENKSEQQMFLLEEKDTQSKLELLLQKNFYSIAISLVDSEQLDSNYLFEISKQYGDHLYSKKDYDGAMKQFCRTIGRLEPSYVIRKFLDANRIRNLTEYLETLHEKRLATSDHTTLLLNCYTKLKDERKEKLDKFISMQDKLMYDVETAIRVCRKAGYKEHALILAMKHKQHDWYIKIHLEDFDTDNLDKDNGEKVDSKENFRRALKYIESLALPEAESYLKTYGKTLISHLPKETTNALIRLCTEYFPIHPAETNRVLDSDIKLTQKRIIDNYKLRIIPNSNDSSNQAEKKKEGGILNVLLGLKQSSANLESQIVKTTGYEDMYNNQHIEHAKPKPESYIHCFPSKDQYWLMIFLENVIWRTLRPDTSHSKVVYNTLIELYLKYLDTDSKKRPELEQTQGISDRYEIQPPSTDIANLSFKDRLLYTLDHPQSNYDKEHVLVLVQSQNFKEGVLKIYDTLGLHYYIIQYYMEQRDYKNVIASVNQYGDKDPNLWVQVLTYFATLDDNVEEELAIVLEKIEKDEILPPLLVVQILGKNEKTKLYSVKDYLISKIQKEQEMIREDVEKIKEFQTETAQMRKEIYDLQTSAKTFQATTCTFCNAQLDLPAVHFMCNHSYHQRCLLVGNEGECRVCSDKHRDILQRKRKFEESSEQHESFFKQLNTKKLDGYSLVCEYFGRGIGTVFTKAKLLADIEEVSIPAIADEDEEEDEDDVSNFTSDDEDDDIDRRRRLLE
ncbi:hypothetical protein NAEGRDRAFT_81916 [Naegleria gruberi]|uniref:Vacuolar protein sorting-associated protein 11 homolog n=1 Tax=Naegleria gruberi TaxID=5762 RepID=D2W0C8_NAEGR|nr:uncharacterized protein NAEGRDRAFT_81916 [Naegleria gruberi]EFC37451.1 hypothetical protein NAEGRDRAFT_81916 [Naegleria gruberi]|eukprot:XP_002670195.1 hypothetical protein NAEGRDRAFT_81916 [Naegleria gruberi strain NEG-M]